MVMVEISDHMTIKNGHGQKFIEHDDHDIRALAKWS